MDEWDEYKKYILSELKRCEETQVKILERMLTLEIAMTKVSASCNRWGAVAVAIPALVAGLLSFYLK